MSLNSAFGKSSRTRRSPSVNPAKKGTISCPLCQETDNDLMVQCDQCDLWYHFSCVGVDDQIQHVDWKCPKCNVPELHTEAQPLEDYNASTIVKTTTSIQNTKSASILQNPNKASSTTPSYRARQRKLDLARLEEEQLLREKLDKEYLEIKEKREKDYLEKKYAILSVASDDEEDNSNDSNHGERTAQWIETQADLQGASHDYTNPQLLSHITKAPGHNLSVSFAERKAPGELSIHYSNKTSLQLPYRPTIEATSMQYTERGGTAVPIPPDSNIIHQPPRRPTTEVTYCQPAFSTYQQPNISEYYQNPVVSNILGSQAPYYSAPSTFPSLAQNNLRLSSEQIAARHAISKDLPFFSGKPEEWPLFYSAFKGSTSACNFSNQENMIRLQRCLKGRALEAVRCRLMLPSSVPEVIETLRIMFGRPELVVHTLLTKLRNEPSPKAEKLESLVTFALSVQIICATMEASGLITHLSNPTLIQELTDKLPSQIKLNWAMFKQSVPTITLSTFSNWLFQIAKAASDVTLTINDSNSSTKVQNKEKSFQHSHVNEYKASKSTESKTITKCKACNKVNHAVKACRTFADFNISQRWKCVRDRKLCIRCLGGHNVQKCRETGVCGKDGCSRKHNPLLHNSASTNDSNCNTPENVVTCHNQRQQGATLFRIVPVKLYGPETTLETFAFLDEGSSLTLIEEELANDLNLNGTPSSLCLRWTADMVRNEEASKRVSLRISGSHHNAKEFRISDARTVKKLSLPKQSLNENISTYTHLRQLPINTFDNAIPKILIGIDNWQLGVPLRVKEGNWDDPVATKTRLGWVIHGKQRGLPANHNVHHFHVCECKDDNSLHKLVKDYFSIESLGIRVSETNLESKDDQRVKNILTTGTIRKNGFYETRLIWKCDNIKLPQSFEMARLRLTCLENRMDKDPTLKLNLQTQIKDYVTKGYARKLTTEETQIKHPRTWYLPLFAVKNPNKPGKVRMVWDAAAKVNGVSLNSTLLKGPDILNCLFSILQRFRERPIAICGDIKEMFHQIHINKEDQHSQRFLWRNNKNEEIGIFSMNVMTFGATCSPSTAQFVKDHNAARFEETMPRAVRSIRDNHYVDDFLDSVNDEIEAIKLAKEVEFIHRQAGFEMHNWISNSIAVLEAMGQKELTYTKNLNMSIEDQTEKVLGMYWCTKADSFTFSLKYNKVDPLILKGKRAPTKREILRTLMSVFDPLGLISHFLVYVKILLQQIWRAKIDWDESIPNDMFKKWMIWVNALPQIEKVKIPRCYLQRKVTANISVQLHIFVDASEEAYAAAGYFRFQDNEGIVTSLVCAKTKVAPQKPLSIPRLELQAAVLGTRLAESIVKIHTYRISNIVFWTDSRTVLSWLNSTPRNYKQFVSLRLGEILENSNVQQWRWVPTKQNVADEATKWYSTPKFETDSRWFVGPEFLHSSESEWPIDKIKLHTPTEELKPNYLQIHLNHENLIDTSRFSKWTRMVRTQAFVNRFIKNIKLKMAGEPLDYDTFSVEEYFKAESNIFKQAQGEMFAEERVILLKNTLLPKVENHKLPNTSILKKLSPYLDNEGVLRIHGRIDAVKHVNETVKHPIILLRNHDITQLIIKHVHELFHHHNHETVVNEIRQKFYIPQLRVAVKNVSRKCQVCKNSNAQPQCPEMASLPAARLATFCRPFSFVGVDYFGPLYVTVGRHSEKRWGVLFTCLTIRAIHLEIAYSLSTSSFIMCLQKFIARRGVPKEIYSDNGTNFKGASKEIADAIKSHDKQKIQEKFTSSGIKWRFNPPAAPHFGGSWERLVRSVKTTLFNIIPERNPTDEMLQNLFAEIETIVNTRPLTYIPTDENEEALTPNHFLLGASSGIKPNCTKTYDAKSLKQNWKTIQIYADKFWRRWIREYLPTLTRRTKWFETVMPIKIGDIVMIVDPNTPRNTWLKGKVLEVKTSRSGKVRQATVLTGNGIYQRPAVKLARLDVLPNM